MKFTDCFQLAPYHKKPEKIELSTRDDPLSKKFMEDNGQLFAWSIYDNLHVLDMNTFKWDVLADKTRGGDF